MQDFIGSFTDFVIGFLGFFTSTSSGRFLVVFVLVLSLLFFSFRYFDLL